MASANPPLTVLMTVYNALPYLPAAVESIQRQKWNDFQFLIVDDGSTDGSREVLSQIAKRDRRIRLLWNAQNLGQTASLNRGLREINTRWIARHDADDLAAPDKLSRQMRHLAAHPQTLLLGTNGWIIDERNRILGMLDAPVEASGILWTLPWVNPFLHAAVVFDRDLALQVGGYDEQFRICQDYDLWERLCQHTRPANLPERLLYYRHYAQSLSKASAGRAAEEADTIARRAYTNAFGEPPPPETEFLRQGTRDPKALAAFWQHYATRLEEFRRHHNLPKNDPGIRDAKMRHHLKSAGNFLATSPFVALGQILRAGQTNPAGTFHWLLQRLRRH